MLMESSPKGRPIVELYGQPDPIRDRGNKITELGTAMGDSAAFLKTLADQTSGQRGKAIEKLQEIVGDTHAELKLAGELYRPTGPVLVAYAQALDSVQPRLNQAVKRCEELWSSFDGAGGYLPGERPKWNAPEAGSPEEKANGEADVAKQQLHQDFLDEARTFDREYDTWEHAFDTAVQGITDAVGGKIEDGFWDNVDGYVATALEVLQVVGIIVGIAAIIIGGPIFAAIATVVGLITLGLTIYQAIRNDTGWDQVVFAAIGCIPFGSAGKLLQQGKRLEFLGDFVGASNISKIGGEVTSIRNLFGEGSNMFSGAWNVLKGKNPMGPGDLMTRFMFGKDVSGLTDVIQGMSTAGTKAGSIFEFSYRIVSGSWGVGDKIATWTGNADVKPSKSMPLVGALL